jgi:hypothetical protein
MNVLFVVRGYPGLGRVMGSLALDSILGELDATNYRSQFASYLAGYRYLANSGYDVHNLYPNGYYSRPNAFCNPFGSEAEILVHMVEARDIDLVVIDGEPLLVDLITNVLRRPVLVLTHPSDLNNPHSGAVGIELFRLCYSRADCVIAHGLSRLPAGQTTLGGRAREVIEINTLIRQEIAKAGLQRLRGLGLPSGVRQVVGVMGGGSENVVPAFAENTLLLGQWLVRACLSDDVGRLTLFCADRELARSLQSEVQTPKIELVDEQVDNIASLIDADLIVGRSGRNLVSEILALGIPGIIVPVPSEGYRYGDQLATAELAAGLGRAIRTFELPQGEAALSSLVTELLRTPPSRSTWIPGNDQVPSLLRDRLQF